MTLQQQVLYDTEIYVPGSTSDNQVAYLRVSANVLALTIDGTPNVPVTGTELNSRVPIRSTGKRKYGIIARHLVLGRIAGTSPNQVIIRRTVPIFDPDLFKVAISAPAVVFSYESQSDWKLVSARNEVYNLLNGI